MLWQQSHEKQTKKRPKLQTRTAARVEVKWHNGTNANTKQQNSKSESAVQKMSRQSGSKTGIAPDLQKSLPRKLAAVNIEEQFFLSTAAISSIFQRGYILTIIWIWTRHIEINTNRLIVGLWWFFTGHKILKESTMLHYMFTPLTVTYLLSLFCSNTSVITFLSIFKLITWIIMGFEVFWLS